MNYLLELRAFKDWCLINQPPSGQIVLWHALMMCANTSGWQEWVSVPGLTLELLTGLSHSGINKARQSLIDRGRIEYRPSDNRKRASKYKIISFYQYIPQKVTELENELVVELGNETGNELENQESMSGGMLYKPNNTKPESNITPLLFPPESMPDITVGEREILKTLQNIPGYPFDYVKDLDHIRLLAIDFPSVDLLTQGKKFAAWILDNPFTKNSNPRLRLRNWLEKSIEFSNKAKGGSTTNGTNGRFSGITVQSGGKV